MADCKYSCSTRRETLDWITAIVDFLKRYSFLMKAHVVNFFKDRLWEDIDEEWISCLRKEKPENLLLIPSGVVQTSEETSLFHRRSLKNLRGSSDNTADGSQRRFTNHIVAHRVLELADNWPASLKEFVRALKSLSFPREQVVLPDVHMTPLNSVLTQGMNLKKKHEVEVLSAIVSSVANSVGAHSVVDVGAGQGYLAQVLSFQYKHSVVAVDASLHHGKVTDARAARIKKHFAAQMRKSGVCGVFYLHTQDTDEQLEAEFSHALDMLMLLNLFPVSSGSKSPDVPTTITCRVLSTEMLKALSGVPLVKEETELKGSELDEDQRRSQSLIDANRLCSLVLAGLHACGDLSVTMLRTFLECKEVKAVVSIGCCYNLLSEESNENSCSSCGFPMSAGLKSTGLSLGKNPRDLACQSSERWSSLGQDTGLQNFDLHAFRAAFQMVLSEYYPEVMATSPSIGRQGKAFRRQQQRKINESQAKADGRRPSTNELPAAPREDACFGQALELSSRTGSMEETVSESDKFSSFVRFCTSAFSRLNLVRPQDTDLQRVWKEAEAFRELIGPYWSIRATLGPVLETLILLDRLLFLQEQGSSIEAVMLPIFNPIISPRNVAIIAKRVDS